MWLWYLLYRWWNGSTGRVNTTCPKLHDSLVGKPGFETKMSIWHLCSSLLHLMAPVTRCFGGTIVASEFDQLDRHSLHPHSWSHILFLGASLASSFNIHLQQTLKARLSLSFHLWVYLRDFYMSIWEHEKLCQPLSSYTFLSIEWNWKGLNNSDKGKFFINCSFLFKCSCAYCLSVSLLFSASFC